ncbi:hypothetical protein Avbf_12251 [Armadillidium vulgare]|nr:hypothetical protein Avbf_12251 [Armadillidium vulgare]
MSKVFLCIPHRKSAKGCMEVQSSVWSAANCMDNNAFICQLTRCYYFDYAVTNRINSSQGPTSTESSISKGNKRLTKLNKDERTVVTLSSENHKPNQGFKPSRNPIKPLQQQNFNPRQSIKNQQNQQPLFPNPGNQGKIPPPNQANEIVPKQVPILSQEILPPLRNFEAASSFPPKIPPATGALINKNLGEMRRLRRKEEFSWAFA